MSRIPLILPAFVLATMVVSAQEYRTLEPIAGAPSRAAIPSAQQDRTLEPVVEKLAQARVALVIGNSNYDHVTDLRTPVHDVEDITATLRRLGFTVVTGSDLRHESIERAVDDFARIARNAEVAVVFYAGYGVELNGVNYLIPTDADFHSDIEVRHGAVSAKWVLDATTEATEDGLSVLILDACRENPFRNWRPQNQGLGAMSGPRGSLIAYATDPGEVASDGQGRNSPFTSALLAELGAEGVEFSAMLGRVSDRVWTATEGQQLPWTLRGYRGDVFIRQLGDAPPPTVPQERKAYAQGRAAYNQRNYAAALNPLWNAAELGHSEAQLLLGRMYANGQGVARDDLEAARLFRLAADQELAAAQLSLGVMYQAGRGVERDHAEAIRLYRLAANQGLNHAWTKLGYMYEYGLGVRQDRSQAIRYYRKAAENGDSTAYRALFNYAAQELVRRDGP